MSHIPMRVTEIKYSSDTRIKTNIQPVDTSNLLQRIKQVDLANYGYTEEWRAVRKNQTLYDKVAPEGEDAEEMKASSPARTLR